MEVLATILAVVLIPLQWLWLHLQGGWLVAVLLILILLNTPFFGSGTGGLVEEIEALKERIEELENGKDGAGFDEDDD